MALNDVALCSRALIRLGAAPITSFADGTAESEIAGALFGPIRDALLSSYTWTFAMGQAVLTPLVDAPVADYAKAFQIPNDYLLAISAGSDGRGRGLHYRIARGAVHTNADNVVLTYIFRPEEEEFPPYFDLALISRLSAEFCIPITENTTRTDTMIRMADYELARARQIDAQQDSPNRIEDFILIDVRS
jgi:hypothetical protein